MGDFTKRLTERRMHTEIAQGHCLIFGSYGRLSWDHVPPQHHTSPNTNWPHFTNSVTDGHRS